jgi:hypothetical protein
MLNKQAESRIELACMMVSPHGGYLALPLSERERSGKLKFRFRAMA